jgi:hypothetical protein
MVVGIDEGKTAWYMWPYCVLPATSRKSNSTVFLSGEALAVIRGPVSGIAIVSIRRSPSTLCQALFLGNVGDFNCGVFAAEEAY